LRVWCDMRCSCSKYSPAPGVEPGSWHLRFRSASVRAHLTGWMWMGHLAPFKLAQGGTAPGGGCYWESRPSCRTRSLKYLPEQMCVDEITLTSAAAAAAAEVPVAPGAQGGATAAREDDRAADLVPEDDAAEAAHDEDQLRLQRGTGSAQGGTVDCAATTELTCSGTGSAQRGTAVTRAEAGPTSLAPDDDSAQGGAAVTRAAPAASRTTAIATATKRQ
jgi:hypothetical protein